MKYLNLGCGKKYSNLSEWTNLDFVSTGEGVIGHNLLEGIPFSDETFDVVYHSHVLEHFSKKDGEIFIQECFRVLKKGGVLRIAVPDLEQIARNYIYFLEQGIQNPQNKMIQANYDWSKIEMYDQTVRNYSGGLMAEYFAQKKIINEEFVYERIGQEGRNLREYILNHKKEEPKLPVPESNEEIGIRQKIKNKIKSILFPQKDNSVTPKINAYETLGRFRLGGEIHQWMYDRYALQVLLGKTGFNDFKVQNSVESAIVNWKTYQLDTIGNTVRKPDSLFVEAIK